MTTKETFVSIAPPQKIVRGMHSMFFTVVLFAVWQISSNVSLAQEGGYEPGEFRDAYNPPQSRIDRSQPPTMVDYTTEMWQVKEDIEREKAKLEDIAQEKYRIERSRVVRKQRAQPQPETNWWEVFEEIYDAYEEVEDIRDAAEEIMKKRFPSGFARGVLFELIDGELVAVEPGYGVTDEYWITDPATGMRVYNITSDEELTHMEEELDRRESLHEANLREKQAQMRIHEEGMHESEGGSEFFFDEHQPTSDVQNEAETDSFRREQKRRMQDFYEEVDKQKRERNRNMQEFRDKIERKKQEREEWQNSPGPSAPAPRQYGSDRTVPGNQGNHSAPSRNHRTYRQPGPSSASNAAWAYDWVQRNNRRYRSRSRTRPSVSSSVSRSPSRPHNNGVTNRSRSNVNRPQATRTNAPAGPTSRFSFDESNSGRASVAASRSSSSNSSSSTSRSRSSSTSQSTPVPARRRTPGTRSRTASAHL